MKSNVFLTTLIFGGVVFGQLSTTYELTEKFDPLPPVAKPPSIGPSGYIVESFGSGTYMVTDGGYQALFVVSTAGVILVDVPPTIGKNIGYAIGNVTDKPVTHLVFSHSHADHIGSASLFTGNGVEIIAHAETKLLLEEVPDPRRPLPTKTFKKDYSLCVGNQTIELSYKGENHCRGNIFIYAKASKVLMLVDVIFPGWVPFSSLAESTNIPNWIKAHADVLAYDFNHYVGGHLGRSGVRSDVLTQQQYVEDLFNNCNQTIGLTATDDPTLGAAKLLGTVGQINPGNYWAQFKVYLDIAAEYCANKTNEKWGTILGGADAFGFENANAMIEHLRLDYNVLGPFRNS